MCDLSILLTRPVQQSLENQQEFEALGARCFVVPLLEILPRDDLDLSVIEDAFDADIVVFSSPNAVKMLIGIGGLSVLQSFSGKMVVPGRGTASELEKWGVTGVVFPLTNESSEGMLNLPVLKDVNDRRIVVFRGQSGRELLAETLVSRGADICYIPVYIRQTCQNIDIVKIEEWLKQKIPILLITSEAALNAMYSQFTDTLMKLVSMQTVFVFGLRLKALCEKKHWCGKIIVIDQPGGAGMVNAINSHYLTST